MAADSESADLRGLAEQLQEMRLAMEQLAGVTRLLANAVRRAPVHLDVEHLQIERVEFNLDGIEVGELGGELNIGITAMQKVRGEAPRTDGVGDGAACAPKQQSIWPPQQGEVEIDGEANAAGGRSDGGAGDAAGRSEPLRG